MTHFCRNSMIYMEFTRKYWPLQYNQTGQISLHYIVKISVNVNETYPDSKVHGANMGPIWGRQDPGGPHVGHVNLAIWVYQLTVATWRLDVSKLGHYWLR